ncbi:MAG: lectin-like protein [Bacteroidota bacterium]
MHPFYTRRLRPQWVLVTLFLLLSFYPNLQASVGCSGPPVITCPPDYQGCPGDNLSPTFIGTATATFPQDCWPPDIGYVDHIVSTGSCSGEKIIERTWRAIDPDDRNKRDSCVQIIRLEADGPTITCPADHTVTCESDISVHPSDADVHTDCSLGFSINVSGPIVTGDPDCPGTVYEYKFTVTDDCGRTAFCKQRFTIHNPGPRIHCPADVTVECPSDIDPHPSDATVTTSCQLGYQVAMEGPDIYGSGCNGKTFTYTFIITDNCGRKDSCEQVYTLRDTTPPVFTHVPPNEDVCGYAPPFGTPQVTDNCGIVHLTSYDRFVWGNCQQGEKKIRTWTATDECGNSSQATQTIKFNHDNHPPVFQDCPYDITVTASSGCDKVVHWTPPTATDNCGTPMVTSNFHPGDRFPSGVTEVRYTARDACGNVSHCSFKITVRGNSLQLYCPQDKYVTCDSRYDGAYVSWNPPHITSSCYSGGGCSGPAPYISGFIYMGEHNGSRYYCSNFRSSWSYAKQYCQSKGGHLAVVNDAQENGWIASQLQTSSAYIGLTDELQEGNWRWVNGEPVTYTNWIPGQPSNSNNQQHYVEMFGANSYYYGKWNDHYDHQHREFVMEIPCSDVNIVQTSGPSNGSRFSPGTTRVCYQANDGRGGYSAQCCFNVHVHPSQLKCIDDVHVYCESGKNGAYVNWNPPTIDHCGDGCVEKKDIPGFIYMGTHKGHHYYCSDFKADWHHAKQFCIDNGGHLATINDQEENDFLAYQVAAPSAYIGLHDENQEGNWEWLNGDNVGYTNWIPGQPNNYNGAQHYVEMFGRSTSYSGKWNDQYSYEKREFIMELPCSTPYQYVGRPNGSWFDPGVHQIRYKVKDKYGYEQYCNFKVIVHCNGGGGSGTYCDSKGRDDTYFWINEVRMGSIQNPSGKDGGYKDYTDKQTDVYRGHSYYLHLIPGFKNYNTRVYWRIWVDWNQDGDFGDYGELAGYAHSNLSVRGVITIPGNAVTGRTRMRISMNYAHYPEHCETFYYGEVEDYSLYIHPYYYREGNEPQAELGAARLDVEDLEEARDFPKVHEIDNSQTWVTDHKLPPLVEGGSGEADMLLFPNPAIDQVNVQLFDMPTASLLSIYNKLGQRIQSRQTDGSAQYQFDISQLPAGVYYLKVDGDEGDRLSRSFVIQR